jgi:hypothetical protein
MKDEKGNAFVFFSLQPSSFILLLRVIDQKRRGVVEELAEMLVNDGVEFCFVEGFGHELHPAVAGVLVDFEGAVTHAEARVTALLDVGLRAAETADEEIAETLLSAGEILVGIHRAEEVVGFDATVEGADETAETFIADDVVNGHGAPRQILAYCSTVFASPSSSASAMSA